MPAAAKPSRVLPLLFLALVAAASAGAEAPPAAPPPGPEAAVESWLRQGHQLLEKNQPKEAAAAFERAAQLHGAPCGECLLGLAEADSARQKWTRCVEDLERALPLLTANDSLAHAHTLLGTALFHRDGDSHPARAEEETRKAMALGGPWGALAQYNLAQLALRSQRWDEAVATARGYLALPSPDPRALRGARTVLCLARAHLPAAPLDPQAPEPRRVEGAVTQPVKIVGAPPRYTQEARGAQIRGEVIAESVIDREGCVQSSRIVRGLAGGLDDSMLATLKTWVFEPATLDGQPIAVFFTTTTSFDIQSH